MIMTKVRQLLVLFLATATIATPTFAQDSYSKLQIFGRQIDDDVPAWGQTINLVTQQIQQSDKRQSSITIPEYVPTNRAFAITFGILGFLGSLILMSIPLSVGLLEFLESSARWGLLSMDYQVKGYSEELVHTVVLKPL